ncbi:MAG: ParA family protein [Salinirussus sp.]
MAHQTLALVGAVGGAGTTRTAVECGAILARDGRDVAVLDAAFATQGLSDYVPGRIDTDLTNVLVEDEPIENALRLLPTDVPGSLQMAPARAPFERVAQAKTAGAAERFERRITAAGSMYDVVILDTPPVAANQSVAAVSAAEHIAVVAPATRRGADGLARMEGVLVDVGTAADSVIATYAENTEALTEADARLPASDITDPSECPSCLRHDAPLAIPIAEAVEAVLDTPLSLDLEEPSGLDSYLP